MGILIAREILYSNQITFSNQNVSVGTTLTELNLCSVNICSTFIYKIFFFINKIEGLPKMPNNDVAIVKIQIDNLLSTDLILTQCERTVRQN